MYDNRFIIKRLEETDYSYEDCLSLIKESFSEHKRNGLHYPCLDYTLESYIENMKDHIIWVVVDSLSNNLVGVCSMIILSDGRFLYALDHHDAVSTQYKGKGIGSLMKEVKANYSRGKCEYMLATTAERAKSVINWHKKNGYFIIRYASYPDTNYYSVVMRKQLGDYQKRYYIGLYCKIISIFSFAMIKFLKRSDGSYNRLGSIIRSFLDLSCSFKHYTE